MQKIVKINEMCIQKQSPKLFFEILDEDDVFQEILSFQESIAIAEDEDDTSLWQNQIAQSQIDQDLRIRTLLVMQDLYEDEDVETLTLPDLQHNTIDLRINTLLSMQNLYEDGETLTMQDLQHNTFMGSEHPSNIHYGDYLSRLSTLTSVDHEVASSQSDDWSDSDMPDLDYDGRTFMPERVRSPFWWFEEPSSPATFSQLQE